MARLAATNKRLARSNKSRNRAETKKAEHELAPSRPVSFPLRAYGPRGIGGDHLRTPQAENADGNEQTEKPLPTQVHTRRGSAVRTALTYTPLATDDDEQTFGENQQVLYTRESYKKQSMNWHDPELYFFLCALAGFATLMAINYEIVSRRRKPPVILMPLEPVSVPELPPSGQARGRAIQPALREHQRPPG